MGPFDFFWRNFSKLKLKQIVLYNCSVFVNAVLNSFEETHFSAYHENSIESAKIKELLFKDISTGKKLSKFVPMKEAKPIVMENYETELRRYIKLYIILGFFGLSEI